MSAATDISECGGSKNGFPGSYLVSLGRLRKEYCISFAIMCASSLFYFITHAGKKLYCLGIANIFNRGGTRIPQTGVGCEDLHIEEMLDNLGTLLLLVRSHSNADLGRYLV